MIQMTQPILMQVFVAVGNVTVKYQYVNLSS